MKKVNIIDAMEYLDSRIIEEADEYQKPNSKKVWVKWLAIAASIAVITLTGLAVWIAGSNRTQSGSGSNTDVQTGFIHKNYKKYSVSEKTIDFPWELRTDQERYSYADYAGKHYCRLLLGISIDSNLLGQKIGVCDAMGYDGNTEKHQTFDVWEIAGVNPAYTIALKMQEKFYVYRYAEYGGFSSFGELIKTFNLTKTVSLDRFECYKASVAKFFKLTDDSYIWEILQNCSEAAAITEFPDPYAYTEESARNNGIIFSVRADSLGVYKQAFYISQDGYIGTNIFGWSYVYDIGTENAKKIIDYAQKNAVETEPEPYMHSLPGRIVEVGEGYVLVDDTDLCVDANEGMTYKLLTTDIRISRKLDMMKIGDLVVITYINPIKDNLIDSAISIGFGFLEGNDVLVLE